MSGPFGSSQWMYQSARDFYEFPIEQSLKFNNDDSSHLIRTPASAGNQRTWTWSCWFKRGSLGSFQNLLGTEYNTGGNYGGYITLEDTDKLRVYSNLSGTVQAHVTTNMVFRDVSAWYHVVVVFDSTEASAGNRIKIYVNGSLVTYTTTTAPSLNVQGQLNDGERHDIGSFYANGSNTWYFDGYLAEVNFIDGQALDPTSFGEFKSGVWIPKDPSGLTYGTNGFRLSFQNDTVSEGFNTALYRGNGANSHSINGLGFAPDFVWIKSRTAVADHHLYDSVRGANLELRSNTTNSERNLSGTCGFHSDGFTVGTATTNTDGGSYVAWCWDAGSGSPVSNTDGSITSTVKANPDYGFSVVSYTGNGTGGATVGHGLGVAPKMLIVKERGNVNGWYIYHDALGPTKTLYFLTNAAATVPIWNNTAPTSSVISYSGGAEVNRNGGTYITYAFAEVENYSKVGSYTGTGANGNAISLGWKPAFVLVKKSSNTGAWSIFDANRYDADNNYHLNANTSDAEYTDMVFQFTDTGFTVGSTGGMNHSGETFIYLAIKDTRDNAFWRDQSGNGNDWQPNNLTYQDSLPDSPTNNFATLNPLGFFNPSYIPTLNQGNLGYTSPSAIGTRSSIGMSTGTWYAEFLITATDNMVGVFRGTDQVGALSSYLGNQPEGYGYYSNNGNKYNAGSNTAYGSSFTSGDIVGVAFDADSGNLTFYKNGVSQGAAFTGLSSGDYFFAFGNGTSTGVVNFGQDSSFAGNKPAQGNTDDNGYGDFYYSPPSSYLALCTANLPDPVIDPAQDDVPADYFNTVLYTGNGSTQSITGVGFQPDLTWIKERSSTSHHMLSDVVRGATTGRLETSNDGAEDPAVLTSFDSDGFSMTVNNGTNQLSETYVAWNWLAGNGTSSNTDGSITSTVSVNQKAGFSVVGYTGNGIQSTLGHGLGATPSIVIIKDRDASRDWQFNTTIIDGSYDFLYLNTTAAKAGDHSIPSPTSSVFTIGTGSVPNTSGNDYIAYCFAEVEGYSKFGSYTGNGSTDGPFVYTGFKPAWVMVKRTDGGTDSWNILDNKRDPDNVVSEYLNANSSVAAANYNFWDFTSNGFKIRNTGSSFNENGYEFIYMAFAENPFKYANAR